MKRILFLGFLLNLSFAKTLVQNSLQGNWELQYKGCGETPLEEKINEARENIEKYNLTSRMSIFGNVIVEQNFYGLSCVNNIQSEVFQADTKDRRKLTAQFDYSRATKNCEEQLRKIINSESYNYNLTFRDRLGATLNSDMDEILIVSFDGKAAGCALSPFQMVYKRMSQFMSFSDPIQRMTYDIFTAIYDDKWVEYKEHFQKSTGVGLEYLDTGFRNITGHTPLITAIALERVQAAKDLLELGASTEAKDFTGTTAKEYGLKSKNSEIKELFQ